MSTEVMRYIKSHKELYNKILSYEVRIVAIINGSSHFYLSKMCVCEFMQYFKINNYAYKYFSFVQL